MLYKRDASPLVGVDRRGELIGWKSYLFMFANVCKARSRPVGAMERDGAGGHVLGVGNRNKFCNSCLTEFENDIESLGNEIVEN